MNKINKKLIVSIVISSMVAAYGLVPAFSEAASFSAAKDTISDSDVSASSVTHTFVATTTQAIGNNGYFEIVFPSGFTGVNSTNLTCPSSGTAGGSGQSVKCTYASGLAAGNYTITLTGVTNPGTAGSQRIYMYSKDSSNVEIEKAQVMVAIIDDVTVTASVDATLTFVVEGLATTTDVNGVNTTGSTTATQIPFGTLTPGVRSTLGQQLKVTTNANSGYTVTVFQDHNLLSNSGADIDTFRDGSASTTAVVWAAPAGTIGVENTYGHFGLTSADQNLSNGDAFGASLYKGLNGTAPMEVMYNNGPADGSTAHIGLTQVAYSVEINALQEAGDYTNTLTYICTPTY